MCQCSKEQNAKEKFIGLVSSWREILSGAASKKQEPLIARDLPPTNSKVYGCELLRSGLLLESTLTNLFFAAFMDGISQSKPSKGLKNMFLAWQFAQ